MRYFIRLECDSDDQRPFAQLVTTTRSIAPYMVDNVDIVYGITHDGEDRTIILPKLELVLEDE